MQYENILYSRSKKQILTGLRKENPFGNAGELQILCCQGFEVKHYDFTLDALTLKPSGVCNVGENRCLSPKPKGQ